MTENVKRERKDKNNGPPAYDELYTEMNLSLVPYWFLAALRVVITVIPQYGYIHPDEYFQSVEVVADARNEVLRKIFGAKRDEVTGEWRKLHNTELHALYSSPDIIRNIKSRRLRWAGHVARMGESRNAYRVLVGRPEGKRPLGRPRRRWEDNIKMDLREVGYDDRDWINLPQDRDQWRAYHFLQLKGSKAGLFPFPIPTRWNSWLESVEWLADNWKVLFEFLQPDQGEAFSAASMLIHSLNEDERKIIQAKAIFC
ncbi:hypothetical protein ANN_27404 [Periplaneta americana]|uniref:Uncharacterized protein n=1 Tax=Periplaneta americana TaxID=6978 RepID=A0ABQ8RVT9_PERAM|nr:hypothetical protein ANN_27404 [Periplaneta americana]